MDKNKLIETAAKHVAKGAYDKAIKEYQAVLKVDPRDVRVLQKMGELYQKKNEPQQAANYFGKVAESYANDGFFLKAVALYKQVLKLNPTKIEINVKLAELHQQLGLMSEALQYLQGVATHHEKNGDMRASLEVLQKVVDLEPDNAGSRMKLADLMAREDMKREAAAEFRKVAEHFQRANRIDDWVRVAERLCQLEPENVGLNRELAVTYLERGDQKRALARLQVCFKADPRDPQTLELLGRAFEGLGQTAKTLSVYKELAKVYIDQGQPGRSEEIWSRIAALDPEDPDLVARRRAAAAPAPEPAVQQYAAPQQAAPVAPPPAAGGLAPEQLAKLLQETDVYVKYGLHDKALEHLRKIFVVDPENLDAHEKAYQIYVAAEHGPQAAEQLLNVLRLCTRQREVHRAQPYLQTLLATQPNHAEVPAFMAVLGNAEALAAQAEEIVDEDDVLVVSEDDEDAVVIAADDEVLYDAADDEALYVSDDDEALVVAEDDEALVVADDEAFLSSGDEPLGEPGAVRYDDEGEGQTVVLGMDADLGLTSLDAADDGEAVVIAEDDALVPDAFGALDDEAAVVVDDDGFDHFDTGSADAPDGFTTPVPYSHASPSQTVAEDAPIYGIEDEALVYQVEGDEEVISSTDADEVFDLDGASAPLDAPDLAYGLPEDEEVVSDDAVSGELWATEEEPLGEDALAAIDDEPADFASDDDLALNAASDAATFDAGDDDTFGSTPAQDGADADDPAVEEIEEAQFFLDQGLFEEARDILETVAIAYPGHVRASELLGQLEALEASGSAHEESPSVGNPVPEIGLTDAASQHEEDAFDLAQELADDFDAVNEDLGEPGGDDFQYSVEEVFSEFKKGLEKVVRPEDVDTHYDLGIAYKEMGLVEDAISEFNIARNGSLGQKKELDCLTMVGMLELMRGDAQAAVDAYRAALQSEFATGPTEVALLFELGTSLEALGEPGKALSYFQRAQAKDPGFRDVGAQVARLSAIAVPEADPLDAPPGPAGAPARSRKVGYL